MIVGVVLPASVVFYCFFVVLVVIVDVWFVVVGWSLVPRPLPGLVNLFEGFVSNVTIKIKPLL